MQIELAVPFDSIEIESQPDIKKMLLQPESFISISEDDFELIDDSLTEATEEEMNDADIEDSDEFGA